MVSSFNVGDLVTISVDTPSMGWGNVKKGEVGVLVGIYGPDSVKVDFPSHTSWSGRVTDIAKVTRAAAVGLTAKKVNKQTCWTLYDKLTGKTHDKRIPYIMMYGPPGTGKTTQARSLANGRPVYSVTVTEDMTDSQIIGHFVPEGNVFKWHDGPAIRAWREGGLLIVNEISRAGGSVLTALYAICDDHHIAQMTLSSGETVTPHENFYCIATMNDPPEVLPEALRDRFPIQVLIDVPHPDALAVLPEDVKNAVETSYASSTLPITYRQARAYQGLVENGVDKDTAAKSVFGKNATDILSAMKIGVRGGK